MCETRSKLEVSGRDRGDRARELVVDVPEDGTPEVHWRRDKDFGFRADGIVQEYGMRGKNNSMLRVDGLEFKPGNWPPPVLRWIIEPPRG